MKLFAKHCVALSLAFTVALGAQSARAGGELVLDCPARISISPAAVAAPEGWEAARRAGEQVSEREFAGAGFSDGDPRELAFLRPTGESGSADAVMDEYDLSSVTPEGGAWLICSYKDTSAFLTKKLEQKPQKCLVPRNKANAAGAAVCR
jgi:hypothetical protein